MVRMQVRVHNAGGAGLAVAAGCCMYWLQASGAELTEQEKEPGGECTFRVPEHLLGRQELEWTLAWLLTRAGGLDNGLMQQSV